MRRLCLSAVVAGALLALALPAMSSASCIGPLTSKQLERRADVIFVGLALEGPTETGLQRFRVDRYLKGAGPETVAVSTGVVRRPDGSGSITSVSVDVQAGERWQIYATKRANTGVLQTSECDGSGKLAFTGGSAGRPTPDLPAASAGAGDGRTKEIVLAAGIAVLVLFSLALVLRRRLKRTESTAG